MQILKISKIEIFWEFQTFKILKNSKFFKKIQNPKIWKNKNSKLWKIQKKILKN